VAVLPVQGDAECLCSTERLLCNSKHAVLLLPGGGGGVDALPCANPTLAADCSPHSCLHPSPATNRHRTVPLVCRAWRQQVNSSPQLLQAMRLEFDSQVQPASARLQSLLEWMLRYSITHVRSLNMEVLQHGDGMHAIAAVDGLSALLGACGAAGALEDLTVRHDLPTLAHSWLPSMRRLRRLTLIAEITEDEQWEDEAMQLCFDPPSWALGSLEDLDLLAPQVEIAPRAHLPPSLTRLRVSGLTGNALPPQVCRQLC